MYYPKANPLTVRLPGGREDEYKSKLKAIAASKGLSVNGLILRWMEEGFQKALLEESLKLSIEDKKIAPVGTGARG